MCIRGYGETLQTPAMLRHTARMQRTLVRTATLGILLIALYSYLGTFTYRLKGFKQQPTDHYTRTYFQFAEKYAKVWQCNDGIPQHKVSRQKFRRLLFMRPLQDWFEYAYNFMHKYARDVPKFLLMHHSLLSHDAISQVHNVDGDLRSTLKRMEEETLLNNTLLIVLADHGHRYSELRETQQGA